MESQYNADDEQDLHGFLWYGHATDMEQDAAEVYTTCQARTVDPPQHSNMPNFSQLISWSGVDDELRIFHLHTALMITNHAAISLTRL